MVVNSAHALTTLNRKATAARRDADFSYALGWGTRTTRLNRRAARLERRARSLAAEVRLARRA